MQSETLVNPDDQRHTKAVFDDEPNGDEMMWQRSLKELWGAQSLTVFRSRMLQKMVWKFRKSDLWVVYHKYDPRREDEDESYSYMIEQLMSRPPEAYMHSQTGSIVTTTTTTTTTTTVIPPQSVREKRKREAATKKAAKDQVFVPPSLVPAADASASAPAAAPSAVPASVSAAAPASASAAAPVSAPAPALPPVAEVQAVSRRRVVHDDDDSEEDTPLVLRKSSKADAAASSSSKAVDASSSNAVDEVVEKENDNLKKAVIDAEQIASELAAEKAKNVQLQKERDDESSRAEKAETLHKNYMQRNRKKMKDSETATQNALTESARLRQERTTFETSIQAERDSMRTKYEAAQRALKAVKNGNADPNDKSVGSPCIGAYLQLINHTKKCYEAVAQSKLTGNVQPSALSKFQFMNEQSSWTDIVVDSLVEGFESLVTSGATEFAYTIGDHSYKARLADGDWVGHCDIVQLNTNPQYSTERPIRVNPSWVDPTARITAQPKTQLTDEDKHQLLFGDSVVSITPTWIDALLQTYSFDDCEHYSKPCLELAELAEVFSSLSSGLTYFSGTKHTTELFVKPLAVYNWLKLAAARKYTRMRLLLHGSDSKCYQGVRDDPFGMDLKFAGSHGQAYGNGFYFGMSDHVTNSYNTELNAQGKREGTALMALVLTTESMQGYHYTMRRGSYGTFNLGHPDRNIMNCLAVYEDRLILVLGKMVPL
jgi:hypothetical protein